MAPWGILTFIFAAFIFVEARRYHQKRETKSHLCDPVYNNTNKVQCYCTKDSRDNELIKSADCYLTIDAIPENDSNWENFVDLENAAKLTFTNTRGKSLAYIPKNALKHTKAVSKVVVKYGNIEIIDPFAFANLTYVREIILTDNQIKVLKTNAFAHHKELVKISLDTNGIVEINRDVFVDLPSLKKIYLTSNKITTIHDRAFVHLGNLIELEIDRNNLFSLNSETFSGLVKLDKLDLSGNSLEVIGDNTFLPLKNLRSLNLEGNKIQMIDEKAFKGLAKLNSLSLAHNAIKDIDNVKTFEGLKTLSIMNLKGNQLKTLKPEVMEPILKNFYSDISSLDVEDNNIPCDCRLDWFVTLMNNTKSPHLKRTIENLKCIPSNDLREKWVKAMESEHNDSLELEEGGEGNTGTDYEYYDETQLNGKLFYTDLRFLLNCTNKDAPNLQTRSKNVKDETKFTITTPIIAAGTTNLPIAPQDLSIQSPKNAKVPKNDMKEIKIPYTTSRLVTVSANPIENKFDDREMADEASSDKIKAHRSTQDIEDTRSYKNNANKNVGCVMLVIMCIRFL